MGSLHIENIFDKGFTYGDGGSRTRVQAYRNSSLYAHSHTI